MSVAAALALNGLPMALSSICHACKAGCCGADLGEDSCKRRQSYETAHDTLIIAEEAKELEELDV